MQTNYKNIMLTLENTSKFEVNSPDFDPHDLVDDLKIDHPLFCQRYFYNGLWRKEGPETVTMLFHERIKWKNLPKMINEKYRQEGNQ